MKYHEILKALIGIPSLSARLDNPFPLVGDKVTISSTSEWVRQHEYLLDGGAGPERSVLDCVLGKSSETVDMSAAGEFIQSVSVSNDSGNASVRKIAYPMLPATEPYFMVTATEIVRVGERGYLSIYAENGYATSRNNTIVARIYKENEPEPVKTVGFDTSRPGPTVWAASPYTFDAVSDRGIYDVEVDVTDVLTGVTFTKRINKLITVTPALAPRDEAVEYLVPDAKIVGGAESWIIDGKDYPAGCTVILKYDPQFGERYPMRLRLDNFKGTRENPIIFTIDTEEPFEFNWFYWFGILFNDCAHIVFDGRGYHNLDKGFRMIAMPEFANIAIQVTNYSNELEFFGIEIDKADFAGFMIKTDPTADNPRGGWPAYRLENLRLHHNHIHDTVGEGSYLGHYSPNYYTGTNSNGEEVRYRAHHLYNTRIYRNIYENQGYDNFQLNNAEDAEICYNEFINGGNRMEKDQTSALALGLSGKIYNNVIRGHFGPAIQCLCMGDVEIFNNIIAPGTEVSSAFYLGGFQEPPQSDYDTGLTIGHLINIHNNILFSYGVPYLFSQANKCKNVRILDNFCVHKGAWGGQAADIMSGWKVEGNMELEYPRYPFDFQAIDERYKIADSINLDYRIAASSPLVEGGCGDSFRFDFNGYKNWYDKVFPIGPFLGKYRSPDIVDALFGLSSIVIDGGAASTLSNKVSVRMNCKGEVTHYRISEKRDFSDTVWSEWSGDTVEFTFLSTGPKTLYCQIKSSTEESAVKSASIIYQESPLVLSSVVIEDGVPEKNGKTVSVEISYSGSVMPRYYRAGETEDLTSAGWTAFTERFSYTFDTTGAKTLYVQLMDGFGQMTETRSASITINPPRKAVVSIGWAYDDVAPGCVFDSGLGINRMNYSATARTFVWDSGEDAGTVVKGDSVNFNEDIRVGGATTGDDSGMYPDSVLEKYVRYNGFPQNTYGHRTASIHLSPGTYRLRLFCSLNSTYKNSTEFMKVQTVVDGVANVFELPDGYDVIGNLTRWLEQEITVPESGMFELQWGMENATKGWMEVPLNIIEIEET
jgi:hypothetical protein